MRSKTWEIIALLTVVVGVLAAVTLPIVAGDLFLPRNGDANVRTVVIRARAPELGGWSPSEVVVKQGERVKLMFYTEDVVHIFDLPDYNINVEMHPGKWVEVEFTADRVGEFKFSCTAFCSPLHALMRGKLIVMPAS